MGKEDIVYLRHIFDAISRIDEYTQTMNYNDFASNHLVQDGVIRQIEIMGEATKKLSESIRNKYPDVPWKDMAGMRDKLIHHYFGVDMEAVWDTTKKDVPVLREKIESIIEAEETKQ